MGEKKLKKKVIMILAGVLIIWSGFGITAALCARAGKEIGLSMWPFVASIDAFVLTSVGFFLSKDRSACFYGLMCALSFICCILQIMMLF